MNDTTKQQLWNNPIVPMLDEYFSPKHTNPTLEYVVEQDMVLLGFNPSNPEDVKKYWAMKGIQS
jgi:hypothetical protein